MLGIKDLNRVITKQGGYYSSKQKPHDGSLNQESKGMNMWSGSGLNI